MKQMLENLLTRLTYSTDLQEAVFYGLAIILISVALIAL
jgi:hypothetical protein